MVTAKEEGFNRKQKKRSFLPARLAQRQEGVPLDFKSWLITLGISLIPLLLGGIFAFMGARVLIVTCQAGGSDLGGCWAEQRLFGLIPVGQIPVDAVWTELGLNSWGSQLLAAYLGGFFFFIGLGLLSALLLPGRLKSIVPLAVILLYGLGLGYLALLVPTLSCRRLEPLQVDCREEYRLAGFIKVGEGRWLKGFETATVDEASETRTEDILDKDGRSTGRTRNVRYTGFSIQLSGDGFYLNWPVFDQTAGKFGWLNYFQEQRAHRIAERLNNFAGDPTQTGLTLRSIQWTWRILMLGISLLLVYLSGPDLIRQISPQKVS